MIIVVDDMNLRSDRLDAPAPEWRDRPYCAPSPASGAPGVDGCSGAAGATGDAALPLPAPPGIVTPG
ncbi:hypothetical protein BMUNKI379_14160, partial [Burkholderia multivorans]